MNNKPEIKYSNRLWTKEFIVIILANLSVFLGFHMLPSTLPILVMERLSGAKSIAGTVIGVLTITAVLTRPFAGKLADSFGRKNVYLTGLTISFLSVVGYAFVPNISVLIILRLIHGVGWGLSSTAASTIASDAVPTARIAEGMGFFIMTSNLAMSVSPGISLSLVNGGNFTLNYIFSALFVVVAFGLALTIKSKKVRAQQSTGFFSSLFESKAILPAAIVGLVAMTYGSISSFIPIYAREIGINNIGPFYTVYAVTLVVVRTFTGRLGDKLGLSVLILPGLVGVTAAMFILYIAHSLTLFLSAALLYGLGFGVVTPALQAAAVRYVSPQRRGASNATFLNGIDMGIASGAVLAGVVSESFGLNRMYLLGIVPVGAALITYLLSFRKIEANNTIAT